MGIVKSSTKFQVTERSTCIHHCLNTKLDALPLYLMTPKLVLHQVISKGRGQLTSTQKTKRER